MVKVMEVMKKDIVTIDAKKDAWEACRIMGEKHIGSLIVTLEGRPCGIFTERDLISKILPKFHDLGEVAVGEFMSSPLVTIGPDADIKEAAKIMTEMHIRRLAVFEKGELVGIFTSSDLVTAIAKSPLEL
jgi:CBS domain-containing protein